MIISALILTAGLIMLVSGGHFIVKGASALAENFKISPLIIGLTIVSFGTSAPELSVNVLAALAGNSDLSFGNIIGSNIANIALIIGVSAVIKPLSINSTVIKRDLPVMILVAVATLLLATDFFSSHSNGLNLPDGIALLIFLCIFIYYTARSAVKERQNFKLSDNAIKNPGVKIITTNLFLFSLGLFLLIVGGKYTVDAAVDAATALNVPKVIIGLTVIAIGTSLPELITSEVATIKGYTDIAIGNVVGSNIFNLLFIGGVTSAIKPIPLPEGGTIDLAMMVFLSFLLLVFSVTDKRRILRREGVFLLLLYFTYNIWRIF